MGELQDFHLVGQLLGHKGGRGQGPLNVLIIYPSFLLMFRNNRVYGSFEHKNGELFLICHVFFSLCAST